MQHPIHFLPPDGHLDDRHLALLAQHCSSQAADPVYPSRTIFTFLARHVFDVRDRVIIADYHDRTYTTERAPNCACEALRAPIECECTPATCDACRLSFTAMSISCVSVYCLYDECPLCEHQRESCYTHVIEQDIIFANQALALHFPHDTAAQNLHAAITQVLGSGAVDAPNYPVTRRILTNLFSEQANQVWTAQDGSAIYIDPTRPAWLSIV